MMHVPNDVSKIMRKNILFCYKKQEGSIAEKNWKK